MRILYVEDNPTNLLLVRRVARQHELISYIDGEEALAKFDQDKPDIVLMDLQLAGKLNGLQVVQALRQRGYSGPVIAVTAYAMMGDRERCLEAGCDDYIAKPLPIPRLVSLFEHYEQALAEPASPAPEPEAAPEVADAPAAEVPAENTVEAEAKAEPVVEAAPEAAPVTEAKSETEPEADAGPEVAADIAQSTEPDAEAQSPVNKPPKADEELSSVVILPEPSFVSESKQKEDKSAADSPGPDTRTTSF